METKSGQISVPKMGGSALPRQQYFVYRAFGLVIHSDLPLPELDSTVSNTADVAIRLRSVAPQVPDDSSGSVFRFGAESQYLSWTEVGRFLIQGTSRIDVESVSQNGHKLLHLPLLGPVMALLLHLRGLLVLHASAIAIGNRGIIFLGDKLAGKSTTAGAFIAAGHRLLTDDVLAIDFPDMLHPKIVPGFPQLKLDADAAEAIVIDDVVTLPQILPNLQKRQHLLPSRFSQVSVPPVKICVLAKGEKASLVPLTAQDALVALIRYSYVTRFSRSAFTKSATAVHFAQCVALADKVPLYRLYVPRALHRLPEVIALLERDLDS